MLFLFRKNAIFHQLWANWRLLQHAHARRWGRQSQNCYQKLPFEPKRLFKWIIKSETQFFLTQFISLSHTITLFCWHMSMHACICKFEQILLFFNKIQIFNSNRSTAIVQLLLSTYGYLITIPRKNHSNLSILFEFSYATIPKKKKILFFSSHTR